MIRRMFPVLASAVLAFPAYADELPTILNKVGELVKADNYPKALEELSWARTEIEKLHTKKLQSFFPDDVDGFKGGPVETNAAMGFVTVERTYAKGEKQVQVSLTGGSGGQGLGNLAQFGKMAAMMGGANPGQETLRLSGRTATLEKNAEEGSASLSIFLDSGPILKLDMTEQGDAETLKKLAGAMKVEELERYLKG